MNFHHIKEKKKKVNFKLLIIQLPDQTRTSGLRFTKLWVFITITVTIIITMQ